MNGVGAIWLGEVLAKRTGGGRIGGAADERKINYKGGKKTSLDAAELIRRWPTVRVHRHQGSQSGFAGWSLGQTSLVLWAFQLQVFQERD